MSSHKRSKVVIEDDSHSSESSLEHPQNPSDEVEENSSADTENEITRAQWTKSKKTLKRKRRATEPSQFGATLQSLLDTEVPSTLPLSLKPSVTRKKSEAKLESQAKKVIQIERKEREDKGRIRDVIGGWGGESERSLRKVAQRGVVRLFNTIQQSQMAAAAAEEEARADRGTGKPSLPAPSFDKHAKGGKGKKKDTIIGRGRESAVDRDNFFDIIRSGGIVSKV
ncbi:Rrp15p-domain-containing protein [Phlebopus sp. FC_14]|nr:Rrp15p-domain-containing protein [Phlebopus sp. FC_14]